MTSETGHPASIEAMFASEKEALLDRLLSQSSSPQLVRLRRQLPTLGAAKKDLLLKRLLTKVGRPHQGRPQAIESGESNRVRRLLERLGAMDEAETTEILRSVLAREKSSRLEALHDRLDQLSCAKKRLLLERLLRLQAERQVEAPLSYGQERTWLMQQMNARSGLLNIAAGILAEGPLNLKLVESAVNRIIERHETLRSRFRTRKGQPIQVVNPRDQVQIVEVDLRQEPAEDRDEIVEARILEAAQVPFDLTKDVPIRLTSFQLEDEKRILLLGMHHIVGDEWSIGILVHEVGELYRAGVLNENPELPDLPIQYADYARWQRRTLPISALQDQIEYWKEHLAGVSGRLDLPTDRPRPEKQTMNGCLEVTSYPADPSNGARELSRQEGVTLFMTLLATFNVLLWIDSGDSDLVVGTDFANRNRGETEHLIGFFVNQLALRTSMKGDPTFRELLQRVRTTVLGGFRNQTVPFQYVLESLDVPRDPSRPPLFQAVLDLHNVPTSTLEFEGVRLSPLRMSRRPSKFDLTLFINDADEEFFATLEFNSDLFNRDTMKGFLNRFGQLLELIVDGPDRRLSELAQTLEEER